MVLDYYQFRTDFEKIGGRLIPVNIPNNIYLFKVKNRDTRKRCEICSKLTIKTQERRHWRHVNFQHISHLFLMFLLLILNK